jgi:hypothetical protein
MLNPAEQRYHLRYRLVTPFGKDGIRRFSNNASQMKKLAAHHFEDLLQVFRTYRMIVGVDT